MDTERGTLRILSGSDFGLTKSGRTRIVHAGYLFPEARDVLRRHARGDSPYLFPGRDGGVRDGTALGRAMNRMAETLGLNSGVTDPRNRVVWHTLRHTFATELIMSGVNPKTVSNWLGHTDPSFTLKIYVSSSPENLRASVDTVNEVMALPEGYAGQGSELPARIRGDEKKEEAEEPAPDPKAPRPVKIISWESLACG